MTSPCRPPSCDLLNHPTTYRILKTCPFCGCGAEKHATLKIIRCSGQCNIYGPDNDPYGHKWNSIPRRSEVEELLRLVDEACIGTPTPSEERLLQYADKLRKEWKL